MSVPANGRASANLATPSRSTPPKSVGVGARARPSTARRPAGRGCAKGPVARHACKIANAQADRACLTSAPVHKYHQRRRARRGRAAPLSWAARSGPPPCRGGPPGRPSAGASSAGRAAPGRPPRGGPGTFCVQEPISPCGGEVEMHRPCRGVRRPVDERADPGAQRHERGPVGARVVQGQALDDAGRGGGARPCRAPGRRAICRSDRARRRKRSAWSRTRRAMGSPRRTVSSRRGRIAMLTRALRRAGAGSSRRYGRAAARRSRPNRLSP